LQSNSDLIIHSTKKKVLKSKQNCIRCRLSTTNKKNSTKKRKKKDFFFLIFFHLLSMLGRMQIPSKRTGLWSART
jgi:hypothetical protein